MSAAASGAARDGHSDWLGRDAVARAEHAKVAELRLMAVHAHPDDESSKGAASLAKYSAEGVGVVVVSCTGGERGEVLNPKWQGDVAELPAVRVAEMNRAAAILGIAHEWLGYPDSGYHEGPRETWQLPEGCFAAADLDEETATLVRLIRSYRPHVMTTYDEDGGYPHPDHLRCHQVSVAAFVAAGDPSRYPEAGPIWQPLKLYYNASMSRSRIRTINDAIRDISGTGPFDEWIARWEAGDRHDRDELITTRVPVADYLEARDDALKAHATQIDPDSHWFAVPRDIEARIWGTDDYELARSSLPTTVPEDDLFSGVRDWLQLT